jgi:hypothetical protein
LIEAEWELQELARINFGKAVYHKEYYKCKEMGKAIEVLDEIVGKYELKVIPY